MLNWRIRRQLVFTGFFAVLILLIGGYAAYRITPEATCTDKRQNQDETGVDCGGSCEPCLTEQAKDLVVVWTRFFEVRPGVYDMAALLENVNVSIGAPSIMYEFRLYGDDNAFLVSRKGSTYSLPNQQFLIFESGLQTGSRAPKRMTFEMEKFAWKMAEEQSLPLSIAKTDRQLNANRPKLIVTLANGSIRDVSHVDVQAIVSDREGNAVGVGSTRVSTVPDTGSAEAVFTWPLPFTAEAADVTILVRKNPWEPS